MSLRFYWNPIDRHNNLAISGDSEPALFERVAEILARELKGTWQERLSGPTQFYWDLRVCDSVITLHREHYLGVMLFAEGPGEEEGAVPEILIRAREVLSKHVPSA
jgi:hypothetical protein